MDLWALWGKTHADDSSGRTIIHPLLCHMVDVAEVIGALWDASLGAGMRAAISQRLDLDNHSCRQTLVFWAACHDLGKACPAFQRRFDPSVPQLKAAGLSFPAQVGNPPCYHGVLTAWALPTFLRDMCAHPTRVARGIGYAVGGHHGTWPSALEINSLSGRQTGGPDWDDARRSLCRELLKLYPVAGLGRLGADRGEQQAFLALLSGLVSVADWIGSMTEHFPPCPSPDGLAAYAERARGQARRAVDALQWTRWQPPEDSITFAGLFGWTPRPMQETMIQLAPQLDEPVLVIIEAPTGSGKTEAALFLADHWARIGQQRGLYVAMPTMATSNQMHGRVAKTLDRRYPDGVAAPLLVHSQARWVKPPPALHLQTEPGMPDDADVMGWFLPRKRSLLAPFGVGTVDQALLSVLQTRHFFVRLFGLAHKTVIFDEVHAYDTYMSTIFARLLQWLRAQGTSVVLLSATLPGAMRRELLAAYGGDLDTISSESWYPAVTWRSGRGSGSWRLPAPPDRSIQIEWVQRDAQVLVDTIDSALGDGGCAAVICNTVRKAQDTYDALAKARIVEDDDLILFHARYPFAWRDEIERQVLRRFGKDGQRPHRSVVVATQVIEQSLDLDFDFMVTDLAPVDLILQRAGRLHRHEGRQRPPRVTAPTLVIGTPDQVNALPDFGPDVWVYDAYVLLRSYLALRGRDHLALPAETQELIEGVYGEEGDARETLPPELAAALEKAREGMECHQREDVFIARQKLVGPPEAEGLLTRANLSLAEDDPDLHTALRALTRLGPPGVSLVCLHQTPGGLTVEPHGGERVDLTQEPHPELTRQLARHTVNVTHRVVYDHFRSLEVVPPGWRKHPLLRNHRAAIFRDEICPMEGKPYKLRLSRELGLEIVKEEP